MAKAKYLASDGQYPDTVAYSQPEYPGNWYVVHSGVVLDLDTGNNYGTSGLDTLLDVLNQIKKEEGK